MYEELSYLDYDDDLFPNWYNIECVKTISNLSRQIRTLLNYRAAIIYHRLCSNDVSYDNNAIVKLQGKKEKFESLALKFIKLLNKLKDYGDVEDGYLYLLKFRNESNSSFLKDLMNLTNQIFTFIHYFSEDNKFLRIPFLKVVMKVAQEASKTQMYLKEQQYEFFKELSENYKSLENEIAISNPDSVQLKPNKRKMGEMITS